MTLPHPGSMSRPWSSRTYGLVVAGLLAGATAILTPWGQILGIDAADFSLVGQLWLKGAVPYRDVFLAKPPMLVPISAVGDLVGGVLGLGAATGMRLVSDVFVVLLAASMVGLVRNFGANRAIAALTGLLAVVFFTGDLFAAGGGLSEVPAFALALLAWLIVERSNRRSGVFVAGLLSAIALTTSYLVIGVLAAVALTLALRPGSLWARVQRLTLAVVGGMAVLLAVLAYFALNGALGDLWSQIVSYNLAYASVHCPIANSGDWPCAAGQSFWVLLIVYLLLLSPLIIAALLGLSGKPDRQVLLRLLAVLVLSLLIDIPNLRRSPQLHYWWPVIIGLLPLAALGLQPYVWGRSWLRGRRLDFVGLGAALLLVTQFLLPGAVSLDAQLQVSAGSSQAEAQIRSIAAIVDAAPSPGPLLVWGGSAQIYLASNRPPLGGMIHLYSLMLPGYTDAAMFNAMCRRIAASQPVIVNETSDVSLLGDAPTPAGIDVSWLAPLRTLVAKDWVIIEQVVPPSSGNQEVSDQYIILTPRPGVFISPSDCEMAT